MSAGTLTVHQLLEVLINLDALALQDSPSTSTIYVDNLASPAVRIVFEHGSAAPGFAESFRIEGPDGTPLYAVSDYAVSVAAFQTALSVLGVEAALATLLVDLGTLALADDADATLVSLKDDLVMEGNDEGTLFEVAHAATSVNAGDGDDVIVLRTTSDLPHFDGGDGYDTLWVDTSISAATISLSDQSIVAWTMSAYYYQTFDGIEFLRGSTGSENYTGMGNGMRFEGGAGFDQFHLWDPSVPRLVDVVTYADDGGAKGIVVNLSFGMIDITGMGDEFATALTDILAGDDAPWAGMVRDTHGDLDILDTGLVVEGSKWADFFYGSDVEDEFLGGAGADHFFGGHGDDEFDGGADEDTFYLSGDFDDYAIAYDVPTEVFTITANDASGTDTITGVEKFSFAGDVKTAAQLMPVVVTSPPVASDDDNGIDVVVEAGGGGEDATADGNVLANDSDADDDPITVIGARAASGSGFTPVGAPLAIAGTYGTLTISQDGEWSYALDNEKASTNALAAGTTVHDSFTYQISAGGETDEATLTIAIAGSNDAPVATVDSIGVDEDTPLVIDTSVLTANDSDPEGDALTVIAVQGATNGTVSLLAGKVTFTPTAGFHGTASFSYTVRDVLGAAATQQVNVVVDAVNDPPLANNDVGLATGEDQMLVIAAATLLANDTDPDNDALTIASVSSETGGAVTLNANGTISFTPTANFNGQARFSYRVQDGAGALSGPATATITVTPVNDAPAFTGVGPLAAPTVFENTTFVASLSALDIDSAGLTFSLSGVDAAYFTIEGNTLRFSAPPDFEAPSDGDGDNVYQVTVIVSDGTLTDTRSLAVSVLDLSGNVIEGSKAADRIDADHALGNMAATGEEDAIDGRGGKDTLAGAAGDDRLLGGKGNDRLNGEGGDDWLQGGAGKDRLDGGAGLDTADYSDATKSVVLTLNGTHLARARVGGDSDDTLKNIENVTGGKRGDQLTGDREANVLAGNRGNDVLAGALGTDMLSGGAGRDRFVFDTKPKASNVDTILDFVHNADRIALDNAVFKTIGTGLSAGEFRSGAGLAAAIDRNDRIVYDTDTGALYYDRDGNKPGGAAAVQFATLIGAPAIDAGDFLIV